MKFSQVLAAGVLWALVCFPAQAQQDPYADAVTRISTVQSMLEFFFMEAGVYPAELEDLNRAFNERVPKGFKPVPVPLDPATNKPFAYQVGPKHKSYTLGFPDAAKYSGPPLKLTQVQWGWLAWEAERKRFEQLAQLSKEHMELLATQLEMFAKDNGGKYPTAMDELFPKYIRRHPQDPLTGKNYQYKPLADGYIVSNPNPERYGLKLFQYSSSQGWQVEALPAEPKAPESKP